LIRVLSSLPFPSALETSEGDADDTKACHGIFTFYIRLNNKKRQFLEKLFCSVWCTLHKETRHFDETGNHSIY
jgi:hypothetical protein